MVVARESLKIVVVGHVDHGKSTVIGRLLYDTKSLPEGAIERVKRISQEKGKPFEYAYLLDAFEEEQKQGITIDTTQLQFHTEQRDYVIIDAPGHKEFLKNMISGAANAEAALLIVDANEGIQEQSKRHGYILSLLGIQKVYVLINKMDLIGYSEAIYNQIKKEMHEFLGNLQVYPLKYIPVSAFWGENITLHSGKMPWYKGEPLLTALDLFEKDRGLEDKALRFPIQDVYKFDHRRIIAGRIEAGTLREGDEIVVVPGRKTTRIKTIEYWAERDKTKHSQAGMSVGITVEDEFFNQRGEMIVHKEDIPLIANTFKANIFWMGKRPLQKGQEYKLKLVTQEVECEIYSITKVVDATTLAATEDAGQVNTNDVAEVIIRTKREICFDEFRNNPVTGRFVLVDGYEICGGGIVSGLVEGLKAGSSLVKQDKELIVGCFDEYYYILSENRLERLPRKAHNFHVGDVLPITGDSYEYPQDFDLVDASGALAAKVRNAKLQTLVSLAEYTYSGVPVLNPQGFYVRVASAEDLALFRQEYAAAGGPSGAVVNKWLSFGKFREVRFLPSRQTLEVEYHI